MDTTERNHTTLAWILATLIGLGIAGGIYWSNNRTLTNYLDQAEQRADSLLSVKLQLEGDIRDLNRQLKTSNDDKAYLDQRLETIHGQLDQRNQVVYSLRRHNAGQIHTIQALNQHAGQLSIIRDSLEYQMMAMRDKIKWQSQSNEQLSSQKNELQQEQDALKAQVLTMTPRSSITGDAFLVEVSKPNRKITAKARKMNTLTVSLNVPAAFKAEGDQEVFLSLTDKEQKPMMPPLHNTTVTLPDINEIIPVHASQTVNFARTPQRISFICSPATRVKSGVYRASIFTKDAYLGSVEFRLRDSFWFF